MNIDIIISADDIKNSKIKDKTVVVIDMLRATSVIVTAINNGCKEVIPVVEIDKAMEIVKYNRKEFILGGERNAVKIDGFDFSNSPLEYTMEKVNNKTVVITTTNGTKAISRSVDAKNILIGCVLNAQAVARRIIKLNNDVVIVNAGTNGEFSIDDFICSGYIINKLIEMTNAELTDIAKASKVMYESNTDIKDSIRMAKHFNILNNLNCKDDIEYCCTKDLISIVPEYDKESIRII